MTAPALDPAALVGDAGDQLAGYLPATLATALGISAGVFGVRYVWRKFRGLV